MARTKIELTSAYQQISAGVCVIRIKEVGDSGGVIGLNDAAGDATAMFDLAIPGEQYAQTEAKPTYAKGEGIVVIVDEAG